MYRKLGIKKARLIGNSLGGWIAWEFALKHPRLVSKLVLIDPAGFNVKDLPWVVKMAKLPLTPYLLTGNAPRFVVRYFVESVYGDPEIISEEVITRYHELFLREGNGKAFFDLSKTPLNDNSHLLKNLKLPVLILWGGQDKWISPDYAKFFHSAVTGSKLILFPLLGHVPMEESPLETLEPTLSFLKDRI